MDKYSDVPWFVQDFLIHIETIKGQSPKTTHEYYYDIRTFLRFLIYRKSDDSNIEFEKIDAKNISIKTIGEITLTDLYEFMSYINSTRKNSASSRARKVSALRSFYKYLHSKVKLIQNDPTVDLDSPKIGKKLPKYLDLESSKKLLKATADNDNLRDFCIITLLLNCGLRVSELCGIDLSDIRTDTLTVIGKGNKERTIYLNSSCINAINDYLAVRKHDRVKDKNALFLNHLNSRIGPRGVQLIIKKYLSLAGLDTKKYSTHKLRHTAATLMYKYGKVDVLALQHILGHESVATTQIYTHTDDEHLREATESNPLAEITKDDLEKVK